ncbi:MAG: hypothetical protein BA871_13510 [Desulfuromonadales bacterium C00003096]|nr:MAG: hypothetical protein BA871_13510 [Desulfuromonadales bacterium C00003096]
MSSLVFVIDIKKDDAVVRDGVAMAALIRHATALFATNSAPLVNQPIVATADIFFQTTMVNAAHLVISVTRVEKQSLDNLMDASVTGRILFLDLLQLGGKLWGGKINKARHG